MEPTVYMSQQDASVNFVWGSQAGQIEARYVRRRTDRFIVYLSVQTGCNLSCRMCHLTQSGQTRTVNLQPEEIVIQARTVLAWYQDQLRAGAVSVATGVDYSFMARGDFMNNPVLLDAADELLCSLEAAAKEHGLTSRVKISTIMPRSLDDQALETIFQQSTPDVYYSLYSVDPAFRERWLPRAMDVRPALDQLMDWQQSSRKLVVLHSAFIAGENDSRESILGIGREVAESGLRCDYNVVRYNPYSPVHGAETAHLSDCVTWLREALPTSVVTVIDRVGRDVYASCGMFMA